jgi:hypothetical protein
MVKAFSAFFSCYLITLSCMAGAQPADCEKSSKFEKNLSELETVAEMAEECPKPTRAQFTRVCDSIYGNKIPTDGSGLGNKYQEDLWEMSCATPNKDSIEEASKKIQNMWNKSREEFSCQNFSGVSLRNANVAKFSIDVGYPSFLIKAVKTYKLDLNFKDPADGKTVLDFIDEQKIIYEKIGYEKKVKEYNKIYKLLLDSGAKHAKDL